MRSRKDDAEEGKGRRSLPEHSLQLIGSGIFVHEQKLVRLEDVEHAAAQSMIAEQVLAHGHDQVRPVDRPVEVHDGIAGLPMDEERLFLFELQLEEDIPTRWKYKTSAPMANTSGPSVGENATLRTATLLPRCSFRNGALNFRRSLIHQSPSSLP